jgi:hypothetical protein
MPVAALAARRALDLHTSGGLHAGLAWASASALQIDLLTLGLLGIAISALVAILGFYTAFPRRGRTFLVDFYCYRPPDRQQTTHEELVRGSTATGRYTQQSLDFVKKVMAISGLGDRTFLPDAVRAGLVSFWFVFF